MAGPNPGTDHISLAYRPDIDGLRAIAVLSVVCYHAFPVLMPGGFIGVDIFFVISGYLITSIVLGDIGRGGFRYADFYARRVKRLFPALLTVMLATLAAGWWLLWPGEFRALGKHLAAGAGFLANIAYYGEAGYFDANAETKPLLHLWSLAVEEQFYIVWPVLLMLAARWHRRALAVLVGVAALSFIVNVAGVHRAPSATFYLPFSRFWELAAGGVLACMRVRAARQAVAGAPRVPGRLRAAWQRLTRGGQLASIVGAGFLLLGFAKLTPLKAFPGWWALAPVLGATLLIAAGPGALVNRRLLSLAPMVWVGRISYPLYLWHWPLLAFAHIAGSRVPPDSVRAACVAAAVLLAWLTWRVVENRGRRSHLGPRATLGLSAGMVLVLLAGLAMWRGLPHPRHAGPLIDEISRASADFHYTAGLAPTTFAGQAATEAGRAPRRVVLFGDSHAEQYAARLAGLAAERGADAVNHTVVAIEGACPPVPGIINPRNPRCDGWRAATLQTLLADPPDTLIVSACWNCYFVELAKPRTGVLGEVNYQYRDPLTQQLYEFRDGDGSQRALAGLVALVRALSQRTRVVVVLGTPVSDGLDPALLIDRLGDRAGTVPTPFIDQPDDQKRFTQRMAALMTEAGAFVVDPTATLCPEGRCRRTLDDGTPIWRDEGHLRASHVRISIAYLDGLLLAAPR
ncbi:O-acetyltransferase OatA [Xylophilus ampelinus]|nr:acyltransferase [Variovorax sp.]VTY39811.1 O-acetyltransferase OatA [Xylophilus ampelinus]